MSEASSRFVDLAVDEFPIHVRFFRADTGEQIHEIVIAGPGAVVVPSWKHLGTRILVETTFPDGRVQRSE